MKKLIYLIAALALLPLSANAQDDMYFSSKKQKKEKAVQQAQKKAETLPQVKTYDRDDVIYNGTGIVSEALADTIYAGEAMPNDTLYIDEYETFEDGNGGRWINGFKGGVDDYKYAVRNMNWRSFSTAVPVGSSAYWNVAYGPASFDWNIYERGGYAYLFPTWSNPLYWDYKISPSWGAWGWHNPWSTLHRYSYYAWGPFYDPFLDPFYYDPFYVGFGYHWGGYYGGYWGAHYHGYWGHHYGYSFNPGRSQASYTLGSRAYRIGSNSQVAGIRTRSGAETRAGQVHRTQDRTTRTGSRVTGRSVRSTADGGHSANSVRSAVAGSRAQQATEGQTAVRRGVAGTRTEGTRSTSSYTRNSSGVNSTYTRPSSTRATRSAQGTGVTRGSAVRSTNGNSGVVTRSAAEGSSRSVNRSSSYSTSRSSSYSSGSSSFGGGYSGGGSRGGSSSGGSRGGGGRR